MDSTDVEGNEHEYFKSYGDMDVHELMLKDEPRNLAYRDAILINKEYIKDKIVLDVGAGTGILSVFCAQVGAAKVYAVEASNVVEIAKEIVKENQYEHVIEVLHGRIEEIELAEKVDIVVSEWMGVYLLHEGMLDSVIYARDQFLKPNGVLLPHRANLYVAPCSIKSLLEYWDNVNGVSMKTVGKIIRARKSIEPELCVLKPEDLLVADNDPPVLEIDLKTVTANELNSIERSFLMVASNEGLYQGICLWFDVEFPDLINNLSTVCLSTSPHELPTHWKQTVIILPVDIGVDSGAPIAFQLKLTRYTDNVRRYNIELELLDPNDVEHPQNCSCFMTKCIVAKAFVEQRQHLTSGKDG